MKFNFNMVGDFKGWKKLEYLWLFLAVGIISILCYTWKSSPIDYISSITGVLCVILVAKKKTSNYIYGLVNIVLYAYLAHKNKLYGDFMLNAFFYFPMQFIGFYLWNKTSDIKARNLTGKNIFSLSIVSTLIIFGYATYLKSLGGIATLADSTSTVLSILATFLMIFKFSEQWLCWIVVNMVSIFMWIVAFKSGSTDIGTLAMWCAFLINSIYGFINWKFGSGRDE